MSITKSSPQLDTTIISLYSSGLTSYQVAEKIGCAQSFIINTLKRCGIERRNAHTYSTTRKYIPNEKFFNIIDTEEKAYVLGFLYADGNNYVRKNNRDYVIGVSLQEEDKSMIERIRDLLSPNSPLRFGKAPKETHKNQYGIRINSKIMSEQLILLGCHPNKSLTLRWPNWLINPELQRHFIRGYFDGDGSLWCKKPKITGQIDWGYSLVGTRWFVCDVAKIISDATSVHFSIYIPDLNEKNQVTSAIKCGGNTQVRKILDWMYKDATIYLERKYQKYQEMIQYQLDNPTHHGPKPRTKLV